MGWAGRIAAVLALVYAGFFAFMYWQMTRPPELFGAVMSHVATPTFVLLPFERMWFQARKGTLEPGDAAPDFELPMLDGNASVKLSSLRDVRPVVLIFGSYT